MNDPERMASRVPQTLDEPMRFLWYDFPQGMVLLLCIGVGTLIGSLLAGAGAGLALAHAYGKLRAGRHPMYSIHILYWRLPAVAVPFKATPPSCIRFYRG